ncbi:hypothetical protein [Streptomyces lydicus]|uniref:hypothetical protein n=1 Tax=Streptomyces lydicus TaxID=47763 RepID=UPI00371D8E8B
MGPGFLTRVRRPESRSVKTKAAAEHSTRALIGRLAGQYGLRIDDKTARKEFRDCFGRNHEHPDDGRFDLTYSVRSRLPGEQHGKALRPRRRWARRAGAGP